MAESPGSAALPDGDARGRSWAVVLVLLAAVCFGSTGTAQAFGPDGTSPLGVGAARILVGGAALALVATAMMARRRSRVPVLGESPAALMLEADAVASAPAPAPHPLRRWATAGALAVGALGVVAYQPAFFLGTRENGVAVGTVIALGSAPVFTGALDWVLRRRFPGLLWSIATPVAVVGVALLAAGPSDGAVTAAGLLGSLGAGVAYAAYTLASKALIDAGWAPTSTMGAVFGLAALASVPLLLMSGDLPLLLTPAGLAMTLWLGLVTTTLAYLLFAAGLARLPAPTVATLTLAEPLTATALGLVVLHEVLTGWTVAGLSVLAAGILVLVVPAPRPPPSRLAD